MEINQYLFGFEFHFLCTHCPGMEWSIIRHDYGPASFGRRVRCPLCAPFLLTGRFYRRWK